MTATRRLRLDLVDTSGRGLDGVAAQLVAAMQALVAGRPHLLVTVELTPERRRES